MWFRKLEITVDFFVSFCALQVARCILFFYLVFFHTLRKLLEIIEHVNKTL
jgi:uncharacterized protein YybS (DUF2232 family)